MDQVPEALLALANQSVTAWLVPNEMAALRKESRRRGLAPSLLARELIVSSLKTKRKEKRRGLPLGDVDDQQRTRRSEGPGSPATTNTG
jgi:hypothetical protein